MSFEGTEAQQRAIALHERNLVVLAAAGSGKTHVLVERYLALLAANPDWPLESLVAITFTRKAARETRERVRRELQQRSQSAEAPQRKLWQTHLASVDSARIDTIHGLCARILRVSAAEAGIDPDFDVLDADEAVIELEKEIEDVLQRLAASNDPSLSLFAEYDRTQIVAALREQVGQHDLRQLPENLLQRWQQDWEEAVLTQLTVFQESDAFKTAINWLQKNDWPLNDKLGERWSARAPLLLEMREEATSTRALEVMRTLSANIPWNAGKVENWDSEQHKIEAKEVLDEVKVIAGNALKETGEGITELDERAATMLPHWQRLIEAVKLAFQARKQAGNQLEFNDLERLTRDILQQKPVRERFRHAFRQVLVDEFHDTSPIQWEIIRALADPGEAGRLFIVGDPRQSIYGFRGADVRVFFEAKQQVLASGGLEIPLSRSFRSHQPLLDVLNGIFHKVLKRDPGSSQSDVEVDFGDALVAERQHAPSSLPALELMTLDLREADLKADDGRRCMARALADRLRALVEQGREVFDSKLKRTRAIEFSDIALLFQTHRGMPFHEEALRELDLPFVTVGGQGFYGRQEVLDLLNLLRALHNHDDDLALASALRSPLFALSDDALLALRLMRDEDDEQLSLWEALQRPCGLPVDEEALAGRTAVCLARLAKLAGRLSVDELLREALQRTGYLATLTGLPDGHRRRGNVEKLLEKAAAGGNLLLTDFEQRITEFSTREMREGDADLETEGAITLMTVHQAKGLEFPVVVLTDAGREFSRGQGGRPGESPVLAHDEENGLVCKVFDIQTGGHQPTFAWHQMTKRLNQRDISERRRLFYVAATRAKDHLLVCGQMKGVPARNSWLSWMADALGIGSLTADGKMSIGRGQVAWQGIAAQWLLEGEFQSVRPGPPAGNEPEAVTGTESPPTLLHPLPPAPARFPTLLSVSRLSDHYVKTVLADQAGHEAGKGGGANPELGNVVHEALHWWLADRCAEAEAQRQLLRSLVWSQGVRSAARRDALVLQASEILETFGASALFRRLAEARECFHELPFIQWRESYAVQGSIDLLFQDAAGDWTLVDFKTSLPGERPGLARAREHARRFHLQLGLYAAAVCQQPDIETSGLTVQVHYLQHALDVTVPTAEWQDALLSLDSVVSIELQKSATAD